MFKSFRARLTWFFVIIVIFPIVMVTAVLFRLVTDSEQGRVDARLAQAQTSASSVYRSTQTRAGEAAERIAASRALARAIATRNPAQVRAQLTRELTGAGAVAARLELTGRAPLDVGEPTTAAGATTRLGGDGILRVAVTTADGLAGAIRELTGADAVVATPGAPVAGTLSEALDAQLPGRGEATVAGREYRVTSFDAQHFDGRARITLLVDAEDAGANAGDDRLAVVALLLAFVLLAFLFGAAVSRSLQSQINRLLQAARRLGSGDLDAEVPTEGDDEFAALGSEFNHMARQLKGRLGELEAERERLQSAIRRTGESMAAQGTDRSALLEIIVRSAVDGVAASAGRASVRESPGEPLRRRASIGDAEALAAVLDTAEREVLETSRSAEVTQGDAFALSHPLHHSQDGDRVVGLVSVARRGQAFSTDDEDLFHYLAGQAAVSIEKVDLQESVQRQAVTDGLTGLFNHRRFQEVMTVEVERCKRFGQPLGLLMLDLDDFKQVNDRWGHVQGDQVLKEVARVLLDTAREIDEPARYGGEELAVVLPQTDLGGTVEFAERLRDRIAALEVPALQGEGTVRITASVGAAALPDSAAMDKDALVQAADSALYRAKRLGKNRVVKAG